jgi:hypothetical protein
VTILGPKRSLPFIATLDRDPIIGILQVKGGEDLCAAQSVKSLSNKRERSTVLDCNIVQSAVINVEVYATILLLCKDDRRTRLGYAIADPSVRLICDKVMS